MVLPAGVALDPDNAQNKMYFLSLMISNDFVYTATRHDTPYSPRYDMEYDGGFSIDGHHITFDFALQQRQYLELQTNRGVTTRRLWSRLTGGQR